MKAAHLSRRFDRRPQLLSAMHSRQLQDRDHLACPGLLAQSANQPLPESVVTGGPATHLTALLQGFGSGHCAGLMLEHIQVVLQVEHLLLFVITSFVPADALVVVP